MMVWPSFKARTLLTLAVVMGSFVAVFTLATRGGPGGFDVTTSQPAFLPEGTRVVFLGDSITAGAEFPGGYVDLIRKALEAGGSEVDVIASGVEGDDARDLMRRLDRDALALAPTTVVVYVGVNDVASVSEGAEEVGLANYRAAISDLIDRIQGYGAGAIVCTPGLLGERLAADRKNQLLERYAAVVREVAGLARIRVCDVRATLVEYLNVHNPQGKNQGVLTRDGIHLNDEGNRLVAGLMLRVLGAVETP